MPATTGGRETRRRQVGVAEQELNALAGTAGGVSREAWNAGEVGGFVEGQQQPWMEHATEEASALGCASQQRQQQCREQGPAALGFFRRRDQVERAALLEHAVEVERISGC